MAVSAGVILLIITHVDCYFFQAIEVILVMLIVVFLQTMAVW